MNFGVVCRALSLLGGIVSMTMTAPVAWALKDGSNDLVPLVKALLIGVVFSVGLWWFSQLAVLKGSDGRDEMGVKEACSTVTFSWIIASLIGSLPYLLYGATDFSGAFFEAMSGFTTTGASVFSNVEALPRGILFWRALTHWIGGMGIIVLSLAILPFVGIAGMELFKAEVPTPIPEKLTPRVHQTALLLWGVYGLLTLLQTGALMLCGLSFFDSLCHAFATMATGGFSTLNGSVGQFANPAAEWVIIFFMFLAGVNFTLHFLFLKGRFRVYWRDEEFRVYSIMTLVTSTLVIFSVWHSGVIASIGDAVRHGLFQLVSIMTTTGFVTQDYALWSPFCQLLLMLLMLLGACAGSTAGGIKHLRGMILLRRVREEMMRLLQPRRVTVLHLNGAPLHEKIITSVSGFFLAFLGIYIVMSLAMAALGYDLITALSSVAASLGNTGPGLGAVGPTQNYSVISAPGQWLLALCMLFGRLEVMTVLVLFLSAMKSRSLHKKKEPRRT